MALPRYIHAHSSLKEIEVCRTVLSKVTHVPPVALGNVTPERPARGKEGGEQFLAEVVGAGCGNGWEHGWLEQVNTRIDGVAEHLAPGRLLEKAEDPSLLVVNHDAIGQWLLDPGEHHGRLGVLRPMESDGFREVKVREDVRRHDQNGLVAVAYRELD